MNIAIVTGASSGIGYEFSLQIAEKFNKLDEIWLIARNYNKLNELADKIHIKAPVKTRIFSMDICNSKDIEQLSACLIRLSPVIRILVNSAGFGYLSDFTEADKEIWLNMIDLNCKSLADITYMTLPYMMEGSEIINMSSSAAFMPQPGFSVYSAGKSFVLSFSRSLNAELKAKRISVTAVCPGPVDTPFFKVSDPEAKTPAYKKFFMASADKVVKKALKDSAKKKEMSVYGAGMKTLLFITKLIPHKLLIWIIRR